jgi:hypothetical protein
VGGASYTFIVLVLAIVGFWSFYNGRVRYELTLAGAVGFGRQRCVPKYAVEESSRGGEAETFVSCQFERRLWWSAGRLFVKIARLVMRYLGEENEKTDSDRRGGNLCL